MQTLHFLPLVDNFQHLICQSLHSTQLVGRKAFRKRSFMSKRKQGDQWSNGTVGCSRRRVCVMQTHRLLGVGLVEMQRALFGAFGEIPS